MNRPKNGRVRKARDGPGRRSQHLDRFDGAQVHAELRELHPARPTSESEELADWAELGELLATLRCPKCLSEGRSNEEAARLRAPPEMPVVKEDGRSRRASFKAWLREHTPLVYATLYDDPLLGRLRRAEMARMARVRRAALAYCVECRNPLVATEHGFQFCPYERAGQHAKVARARHASSDGQTCASTRRRARQARPIHGR